MLASKRDTPEVLDLFDVIEALIPKAIGFDGVIIRSVGVNYASESDFLSGDGAGKYGGRWNPVGLNSIYGATDIITATMEAYQNFLDAGFSLNNLRPRVTAGAKVTVSRLLDLTDNAILDELGFSKPELLAEDWQALQSGGEESWTQAIGRGSFERGFEGLIANSARNPDGLNIVLFPSVISRDNIRILGKSDLPPHPEDWPAK